MGVWYNYQLPYLALYNGKNSQTIMEGSVLPTAQGGVGGGGGESHVINPPYLTSTLWDIFNTDHV